MNQKEFIKILQEKHYSYRMMGSTIVIDHCEHVNLDDLIILPESILFKNNGYVALGSLTALPENIKFENNGEVYLKTGLYKHGDYSYPRSK